MSKARLVALAALAAVVLPYFACDGERRIVDDAARARAPGSFARIGSGVVHYELGGPADDVDAGNVDGAGRRVVLVHGASGPMAIWDRTFLALSRAGFRVLRYDLFGRGLSDRPSGGAYDRAFFRQQLEELLAVVGWTGPVDVVGASMGAVVATDFALAHPETVRRVVLVGPAGVPMDASPAAAVLPIPVLGDYAMTVLGDRSLAAHNRAYYANPDDVPEAHEAFRAQLAYRGYKRAILATMRAMPMTDFTTEYRALGASNTKVFLVWGTLDRTFPFRHFDTVRAALRGCAALAIEGAGHAPQYEKPDVTNGAIAAFLGRP